MSRTWYTSDLHLGHRLVADIRGFESTEAHDTSILAEWDKTVRSDDIVWVLGDIAISRARTAIEFLNLLPGRKRLIAGNHDGCHPMHRKAVKAMDLYLQSFEYVSSTGRVRIAGKSVILSHFPYQGAGDRGPEERYPQWRLPDRGDYLLHGHTHSKSRGHGRMLHVGWDAWQRLVPAEELAEMILQRDEGS